MLLAFLLAALEPGYQLGYVDPRTCRTCHAEIAAKYEKTGMGRSAGPAAPFVSGRVAFYHRASNRHYTVDAGAMRRHQKDAAGAEINVVAKSIDFVLGSGNHARTFVHRAAGGRLLQLPVSSYAEGGAWAMSPGYDRFDHPDFRRAVSAECLFCHSAYPGEWNRGEPAAIDCQRCHGPGQAHVARPSRTNIHGARGDGEVCMQCHLETRSQGIPNAIRREGRGPFSYRPGQPLADFRLHFDTPGNQRFEVNHAGYRMSQSKCAPLSCLTCHDPHSAGPRQGSYRAACQGCHAGKHASLDADCAACHMPKRRTHDAVHVVMTDHRIQRVAPRDALAPRREEHEPYVGPLVPYGPADPLYTAYAQILERNHLAAIPSFAAMRPASTAMRVALGDAFRAANRLDEALRWHRMSGDAGATGDAMLRAGRAEDAVALLEKGERWIALGIALGQLGRLAESERAMRRALAEDPDSPQAWLNLGVTLEERGDAAGARAAYRESIRHQPDFAAARGRLARLGK